MIIVWDAQTGTPVKTIFDPHNGHGCIALDFSAKAKWLVSLGSQLPQTLSVWDWTSESEAPFKDCKIDETELQNNVQFDPQNAHDIVTNGCETVNFVVWDNNEIYQVAPLYNAK
jgi:WD40 repeat protein